MECGGGVGGQAKALDGVGEAPGGRLAESTVAAEAGGGLETVGSKLGAFGAVVEQG